MSFRCSFVLTLVTIIAHMGCHGASEDTNRSQPGTISGDVADQGESNTNDPPNTDHGGPEAPTPELSNPWTQDASALPKDAKSDAILAWLDQHGGWGTGELRIDFGMEVLHADDSTPEMDFVPTQDFYSPDCQQIPFPIVPGGALEGENGYECANDGDCHLLVIQSTTHQLFEMWRANIVGQSFHGGCAVVWDLTRSYPPNLRGEGCTSADAAGFPIVPLLFSADEVAAGSIDHAIRFILPNARIRADEYVRPATHSTVSASGGPDAPPYGVRLRLRSDYPLDSLPSDGARIVAKALQNYGMLLADAGNIALTAQSDRFTQHKWDEVQVDSFSLTSIKVTDMEVVDMGDPIPWSGDCFLNP